MPTLHKLGPASLGLLALAACGGPKMYTKRTIDTPAGERDVLGPPRNTAYAADVQMEHNIAHIKVFERSECPVIKVRMMSRIEETLDGSKVVERVAKGTHELSESSPEMAPCEQRFGRVPLMLDVGANHYPLGETSPTGDLHVDLASVIKARTRGVDLRATPTGTISVGGRPVYEIALAGLVDQQARVDQLVAELTPLLGKSATKLTDEDVTKAYVAYGQLRELAPDDARVVALQRRFVEVVGGFRDVNKTASLKRNLEALGEAKDLLKTLSDASGVPQYVQVSIREERGSRDALSWARASALTSLRAHPELCAAGHDWSQLSALDDPTRLAFSYLRAALDDPRGLDALCR
ncbi:MAG: hypothetical protein ABW252_24835 [Polyangiales bacterium]